MRYTFFVRKVCIFLCIFLWLSQGIFAYSPTKNEIIQSEKLAKKMNRIIQNTPSQEQKNLIEALRTRINVLQNALLWKWDEISIRKMALYEYLRRHIVGVDSFERPDIIYDELDSTIWNHAPKGFDILYQPYDTPRFENADKGSKYRVLINGGYFLHDDNSIYHSGQIALNGNWLTPFVDTDPQITHSVCLDASGKVSFIKNSDYTESLIASCRVLFQAGPLLYSRVGWVITEEYREGYYIGLAHKRTMMILFENHWVQDLWFLTINDEVTLKEARNIILRETRFIGEFENIFIFNLDGGSSVAHMNREYPELNIGKYKILPTVIAIP